MADQGPTPRKIKRYGWIPDLPDQRDLLAPHPGPELLAKLPDVFSGRAAANKLALPYDQGQLGSCTGNGVGFLVQSARALQKLSNFVPSRLFIYYCERMIEGTMNEDAGAIIRDGMKSIAQWGAPRESEWPYDITKFTQRPPATVFTSAARDQATQYMRCARTMDAIKGSIYAGYPVVFGFSVYESFEGPDVAKTGILPMPQRNEKMLGGHCVVWVGWDDRRQLLEVRNSWGTNWGDGGYFWMPYQYALDPNLSDDFWSLRLVETTTPLI